MYSRPLCYGYCCCFSCGGQDWKILSVKETEKSDQRSRAPEKNTKKGFTLLTSAQVKILFWSSVGSKVKLAKIKYIQVQWATHKVLAGISHLILLILFFSPMLFYVTGIFPVSETPSVQLSSRVHLLYSSSSFFSNVKFCEKEKKGKTHFFLHSKGHKIHTYFIFLWHPPLYYHQRCLHHHYHNLYHKYLFFGASSIFPGNPQKYARGKKANRE